jgi:hypothetical protein
MCSSTPQFACQTDAECGERRVLEVHRLQPDGIERTRVRWLTSGDVMDHAAARTAGQHQTLIDYSRAGSTDRRALSGLSAWAGKRLAFCDSAVCGYGGSVRVWRCASTRAGGREHGRGIGILRV